MHTDIPTRADLERLLAVREPAASLDEVPADTPPTETRVPGMPRDAQSALGNPVLSR